MFNMRYIDASILFFWQHFIGSPALRIIYHRNSHYTYIKTRHYKLQQQVTVESSSIKNTCIDWSTYYAGMQLSRSIIYRNKLHSLIKLSFDYVYSQINEFVSVVLPLVYVPNGESNSKTHGTYIMHTFINQLQSV